MYILIS